MKRPMATYEDDQPKGYKVDPSNSHREVNTESRNTFLCFLTCGRTAIITGLLIAISITTLGVKNKVTTDSDSITQVVSDWAVNPFVDIVVATEKCPEDYEPLFERKWEGTQEGCLVRRRQ